LSVLVQDLDLNESRRVSKVRLGVKIRESWRRRQINGHRRADITHR
jgi:hypothetical protein